MIEDLFRLLLATFLGGLIGIERQIGGQYAGFRAQILVCVGSCLFSIISVSSFRSLGSVVDPTRIAAQIVVGIGFLGAGAILRYGITIRGLTTAASLWMVSAIGMASGFGEYVIAILSTIIVLISLTFLRRIEEVLPINRYCTINIKLRDNEGLNVDDLSKALNIKITALKQRFLKEDYIFEQEISIRYRDRDQLINFFNVLKNTPNILELTIS
jgi:putative Mg2+ transporter-C (MgtC) family protein